MSRPGNGRPLHCTTRYSLACRRTDTDHRQTTARGHHTQAARAELSTATATLGAAHDLRSPTELTGTTTGRRDGTNMERTTGGGGHHPH